MRMEECNKTKTKNQKDNFFVIFKIMSDVDRNQTRLLNIDLKNKEIKNYN